MNMRSKPVEQARTNGLETRVADFRPDGGVDCRDYAVPPLSGSDHACSVDWDGVCVAECAHLVRVRRAHRAVARGTTGLRFLCASHFPAAGRGIHRNHIRLSTCLVSRWALGAGHVARAVKRLGRVEVAGCTRHLEQQGCLEKRAIRALGLARRARERSC